ncbi:MAG: T9SS type A sorting domain-containing protein [bacterium]
MKYLFFIFALSLLTRASVAQPSVFESRGPGGGGALFATTINPTDPNEMYISCDMSEIFHSTDLGASWTTLDFRKVQSQKLSSVQFCNNNVRYAIDGANVNGSDVQRPTKSTDGGVTWKPLPNDASAGGAYSLFADPNNSQHVLMSDYRLLYTSPDGGNQFFTRYQAVNNSAGLHIAGVFFDGDNIYVGTNDGLLTSTDGGKSFTVAPITGIPATEYIVGFAGAKENNKIRFFCVTLSQVYAGITGADKDAFKGIYKLDWGNTAWQSAKSGLPSGTFPFFVGMATNNTSTAYVAGGSVNSAPTIYKTTDGGANWVSVFNTTNNQNITTGWSGTSGDRAWSYGEYALGFAVSPSDPNYAIITDLGYAHLTSNGGSDWHAAYVPIADQNPAGHATPTGKSYHSVGLENTTCWQINWLGTKNMFGCFSDIKGTLSTDSGATWGFGYTGHSDNSMYYVLKVGANTYGATSSIHDMYQSTTLADNRIDGASGKILLSTDDGLSWQILHNFSHPVTWLSADPSDQKTLYASVVNSSSGGIYVTHDLDKGNASTWTKLTNPPRTEGHPLCIRVLKNGNLLASFSGHRTTNFTASSGVFLSTNGGTTWLDRSDAGMKYWTWDLVVDPNDVAENTWYAGVFSGWGGSANGLGGLYRTKDAGVTWTKLKSFPDGVTSCTFSPSDPNTMYFTSETQGLWVTNNAQSANPQFSQVAGYPFRQPMRVFFNPLDTSQMWVSSFGHGMMVAGKSAVITKPSAVTLLLPKNGDTTQTTVADLSWQSHPEAVTYEVQVSPMQNFANIFADSLAVKGTTIHLTNLVPGLNYFWRVRATNSAGSGVWSEVWHFGTKNADVLLPEAPVLISPMNKGSFGDALPYFFKWQSVANAKSYRITIGKDKLFQVPVVNTSGITDTTFGYQSVLADGMYYWKVVATGDGGDSPISEIREFTVTGFVGSVNQTESIPTLRIQSQPNPMNINAMITCDLSDGGRMSLSLYDLLGRNIAGILESDVSTGRTSVVFDASKYPSGVYVLKLETRGVIATKMVVIKH